MSGFTRRARLPGHGPGAGQRRGFCLLQARRREGGAGRRGQDIDGRIPRALPGAHAAGAEQLHRAVQGRRGHGMGADAGAGHGARRRGRGAGHRSGEGGRAGAVPRRRFRPAPGRGLHRPGRGDRARRGWRAGADLLVARAGHARTTSTARPACRASRRASTRRASWWPGRTCRPARRSCRRCSSASSACRSAGRTRPRRRALSTRPTNVPNARISHVTVELPVPVGFWRSVGHSHQAFFKECFMDEAAAAAGADAVAFRAALAARAAPRRHLAVLQLARAEGRLGHAGAGCGRWREGGARRGAAPVLRLDRRAGGRGVARRGQGHPRAPRGLRHRLRLGRQPEPHRASRWKAASSSACRRRCMAQITFDDGQVQQSNFHDQPMLRIARVPGHRNRISCRARATPKAWANPACRRSRRRSPTRCSCSPASACARCR